MTAAESVKIVVGRRVISLVYGLGRLGKRVYPDLPNLVLPPASRRRAAYDRVINQAFAALEEVPALPFPLAAVPPIADLTTTDELPEMSIIISSWNGLGHTIRCLASIAAAPPKAPFEVIVVDDFSTDAEVRPTLGAIDGIRTLFLDTNHGYLEATNRAAELARGTTMVLLNNDVQVTEGCFDALLRRARADNRVGAVGARLLYPDGRLQEAGSIVWSDGSGWNYGHGQPPSDSEYRFAREVDYCSAACLLVRRTNTDPLFDDRYRPAYFEDTDLAFRIRDAGGIVLYEPSAVAYHVEGASHGTDETSGLKQYQVRNRSKFAARWKEELTRQHPAAIENVPRARDRRAGARVVVFDEKVPTADRDSGSLRMARLLGSLVALGHPVHFVPADRSYRAPYGEELEAAGVELLDSRSAYHRFRSALGADVSVCILSRPFVASRHMRQARRHFGNATILYDMVDFHFLRDQRLRETDRSASKRRAAHHVARLERKAIASAHSVIAVSEDEAQVIRSRYQKPVFTITNIHEVSVEGERPISARDRILFVGSFAHTPNVDAARWLVAELAPKLELRLPGIGIDIVGADPPADVEGNRRPNVVVHGWAPTLGSFYADARVVIAPLRAGAGMKGKVGEAMSLGVPVVTTSVGAEGFGGTHGRHYLVADDADRLVDEIARLFGDPDLWNELSSNGRQLIEDHFSTAAVRRSIAAMMNEVTAP